ncbi:hypothetical protein CVT24_013076 [Panaeolus cyanescens]|uniref:Uncharacterized protein n=1 Tax=Panaeolus cyanescens TaxID=181874 RepID=A0A409VVG8_9AGAR|nr:hypothetical protein CVT24_013076 [Panaeolus cyanescens]
MFATITIHGFAHGTDGNPRPLLLSRSASFPQPSYKGFDTDKQFPPIKDSSSIDISTCNLHIEARIEQQEDHPNTDFFEGGPPPGSLGHGLAGVVYPVKIEAIRCLDTEHCHSPDHMASHEALISSLPNLCVKIARPKFSRYLAREAWFYERLDMAGLTNAITPKCYGVFQTPQACVSVNHKEARLEIVSPRSVTGSTIGTKATQDPTPRGVDEDDYYPPSPTPKNAGFHVFTPPTFDDDPWFDTLSPASMAEERRIRKFEPLPEDDDLSSTAMAKGGRQSVNEQYGDDVLSSYMNSRWFEFEDYDPAEDSHYVTVLLMEQLGERLTVPDLREYSDDLKEVWDDLRKALIDYTDDGLRQVLRAPASVQRECPNHHKKHEWFMIDYDHAVKVIDASDPKLFRYSFSRFKAQYVRPRYYEEAF